MKRMNDIFTVMKFTMKDMIKRKSFIISTIIILVMIVVGFNVPNIIKAFSNDDGIERIMIVDKDNIYEGNLLTINTMGLNYEVKVSNNASIDEVKKMILDEDIDSAIIVSKDDDNITMKAVVDNLMFSTGPDETFTEILTSLYKSIQIGKLNLTEEEMKSINPMFSFDLEQAEEEANGNIGVMMILSILLFYAVYFCALQVSSSITTEKTSKIIETLVTSTSPNTIVIGKTVGIGVVGLCQLLLFLITAVISANLFIDKEILSVVLDLSSMTWGLGLITLLYFMLGYSTFALMYALTGSTVSKPEDIQSANSPVAIITMIGFYLSYFTMLNPASDLNRFAALFPISSPFCMPFRIMMGMVDSTEVLLSIGILLVTIIVIAKITVKIYSNAILNYGTKLSIKDIISMYKQK